MLPTQVTKPKIHNAQQVHCQSNYTVVVLATGECYGQGKNTRGRMGPLSEDIEIPTKIPDLVNIQKVSCGLWHMLALSKDSQVFSSGSNKYGELGRDGDTMNFKAVRTDEKFSNISAGFNTSFFMMTNGDFYSCGKAGLSLQSKDQGKPTKVKALQGII